MSTRESFHVEKIAAFHTYVSYFHGSLSSSTMSDVPFFFFFFCISSPSACCQTTIENDFSVGRFLPRNEVLQLATTEKRFRHRKVYSLQVLDNDLREADWECCTTSCILFSFSTCVIFWKF